MDKSIDLEAMTKQILGIDVPFMGIPQKPMVTICPKCGTEEATLICRYCETEKT